MQKRLLFSFLLLLLTAGLCRAAGEGKIGIKFERSGTNAAGVAVKVVDAEGHPIEGLTTSLASSHSLKGNGTAVTGGMICPDVNGSSSPTINLTVSISGLPAALSFDKMGLDIHALNGSGSYQQNADNKVRRFNVDVKCGENAGTLTDFATLSDIDIAAGVGTASAVHKYWALTAAGNKTAEKSLVISITVTKGTENAGCFFGLTGITVGGTEDIVEATPPAPSDGETPKADAFYHITWFSNASQYITETAAGSLVVAGQSVTERQYWQFVSTGKEHCYYIRNAATGHYIQSCNLPASSASKINTGSTPVEYYVVRNEKSDASVKNYFRLTSTDCTNYDNTDNSPRGLNKDGASTAIIAYHAGNTNTGSYWMLSETENLYELRPFMPSAAVGKPEHKYALRGTDGRVLEMGDNGQLSWQPRNDSARQAWYFVGSSNNTEGYLVVNAHRHEALKAAGEETGTRWHVLTDEAAQGAYYLRPFARKDEAAATLTVAGDSLLEFSLLRSDFAREAQIYDLPCGVTGEHYLMRAAINGTGALVPLSYPLPVVTNGQLTTASASAPTTWHTIYTQSAATVVAGESFDLTLTLNNVPSADEQAWVYFDWNRDGIFETAQQLDMARKMTARINVPAEGFKTGRTRMRFRLTANGMTEAEDDVVGQTVDFILYLTDTMPETYPVSVRPNDPARGKAELRPAEEAGHVAEATPLGNAAFICWKEGNRIVSVDAVYDFVRDHCIDLVACFSPNTMTGTGIGQATGDGRNELVEISGRDRSVVVKADSKVTRVLVYTPAGELVASAAGNRVNVAGIVPGTYVVKVLTATKGATSKIYLK